MSAAAQRTAAVAGTSALTTAAPKQAPSAAPRRTPLSVVRSAPARRRAPFAIFCLGVLAAALLAVLVLNVSVSTGQYQLVQLRNDQLSLQKQNQELTQQVQNFQAPQNLAARAAQYGMVASTSNGQIDLKTLAVTGNAKAAEKGAPQGAVLATPAVPGQVSAAPAATTTATPAAKPADKPAAKVDLHGGSIPAPAQKTPGQ
jgi:cell division protein FtsL